MGVNNIITCHSVFLVLYLFMFNQMFLVFEFPFLVFYSLGSDLLCVYGFGDYLFRSVSPVLGYEVYFLPCPSVSVLSHVFWSQFLLPQAPPCPRLFPSASLLPLLPCLLVSPVPCSSDYLPYCFMSTFVCI
ncbi:hypothetical protein AMECASPLE_024491 [Ameca splendens]|uniref:Uncharacterized protein n=1 Tax=Ameca splendens TaxID=208324 RepID=A0ABV0XTD1_9TELE